MTRHWRGRTPVAAFCSLRSCSPFQRGEARSRRIKVKGGRGEKHYRDKDWNTKKRVRDEEKEQKERRKIGERDEKKEQQHIGKICVAVLQWKQ